VQFPFFPWFQRTEREIKRLHQDIDRENQAHAQLSAWEASQSQAKVRTTNERN
jgi:hypothetical protein